jgi:hypothetical protein
MSPKEKLISSFMAFESALMFTELRVRAISSKKLNKGSQQAWKWQLNALKKNGTPFS